MVTSLSTPWPVIDQSSNIVPTAAESRNAESFKGREGLGGHTSSCPMSEHQCGDEAMLKCLSIVCLSSFVHLTSEVHSYTGWETRRGAERCTIAAGATRQLIFAQQLLSQTSTSPLKERARHLLINGSVTKGRHRRPACTRVPLFLPTKPFSLRQSPGSTSTTLQRSSRSLLTECTACSLPPTPSCIVPGTELTTRHASRHPCSTENRCLK